MQMSDDPGVLASIGIRVSSLFAGVAGGLVGVIFDDQASARIWLVYAIGGGLVAAYLGKDAQHFAPAWMSELGLGFMLGVCAPIVVSSIKAIMKRWQAPDLGSGK